MTGLFPNGAGLWGNGCALPPDRPTLASVLGDAGYQTAHVGKLHLVPILTRTEPHPAYGFDHHEVGEGDQMYPNDDHWNFMRTRDPLAYVNYMNELYQKGHSRGYTSNLPEPLHHSTWVTDRSLDWLEHGRSDASPFFLNVGYFDPHHAFNPIKPWATMFKNADVPEPFHDPEAIHGRPAQYRGNYRGTQRAFEEPGFEREMARAYHAMVAHIDHCVGRLLAGLEKRGLLDNTIVVFSSDHGEMLGHHGMLHKGPFLLDDLMHVPLIVAGPGGGGEGRRVDGLTSMIDIMRTFTGWAGCDCPSPHGQPLIEVDGSTMPDDHRAPVFAQWENDVRSPDRSIEMVRTPDAKLITYADPDVGELYDLHDDPRETVNRYDDPAYQGLRERLSATLERKDLPPRPDVPKSDGW